MNTMYIQKSFEKGRMDPVELLETLIPKAKTKFRIKPFKGGVR